MKRKTANFKKEDLIKMLEDLNGDMVYVDFTTDIAVDLVVYDLDTNDIGGGIVFETELEPTSWVY